MGWWSATILGGDWPMDVLGDLGDDAFGRIGEARARALLEAAGDRGVWAGDPPSGSELWPPPAPDAALFSEVAAVIGAASENRLRSFRDLPDDDRCAAVQALAVAVMGYGAPLPEPLRAAALAACAEDPWARAGDPERAREVAQLAEGISAYRAGTPLRLRERGLFGEIGMRLSGGRDGRIDAGPGRL